MASTRRRGAHAAAAPDPQALRTPCLPPPRPPPPAAAGQAAGGFRARLSPVRVVIAVLVLGFGTIVLTGGLWSSPSAEPTVQQFLLDWQQHSYAAAAALTTGNPAAVTTSLANAYSGLDAAAFYLNMGPIRQSGGTATAHFTASVDLGQDGAPWMYTRELHAAAGGPVLEDRLEPERDQPRPEPGAAPGGHLHHPAPDADPRRRGQAAAGPVHRVRGRRAMPGRLKNPTATADALGQVTGIDRTEVLGWIRAAPRRAVPRTGDLPARGVPPARPPARTRSPA